MRILHLIATLSRESGGPAQACVEMADAVAARGHDVSIWTTNWRDESDGLGRFENVPLSTPQRRTVGRGSVETRTFAVTHPRGWKPSFGLARALMAGIASYDVVHLHTLYLFHDMAGGLLALRHGVPYVVRPHGMLDPYIWKRSRSRKRVMEALFQDRVLRGAAAIHYTSEIELEISRPYAHNERGRVVPLGVRLEGFDALPDPARFHDRFPETRGKKVVLFLSRLHEKKGLDLLVPAFAQAAKTRPDLHLVLAGPDDGMVAPCKALAERHGVSDKLTFTGMLRGEDKLASFAAASMFALPSYSENFGIAAVEAMAARLPSILSDQVNIWADVQKGGGVEIVTCDVASVTRAIEKVADDAALRASMGEKARATAHDLYAWPSVAAKLEAMYAEAAARRAPR